MKSKVVHLLIGCAFGLLGWWGVLVCLSFFLGVEITQAMYRSFSKGYKWSDIYKKPWVVIRFLPARDGGIADTIFDLLLSVLGATLVAYLRELI